MDEIDAATEVLKDELNKIFNTKKSIRSKRGKAGEAMIKSAIKQSFFDKGYNLSFKGNGTFRVRKQVKANKKGRGGIDFNVEYTDEQGNSDDFFVESKNWGKYSFSNDTYNSEIKDRFEKVDKNNNKRRSVGIPKHHLNNTNIINECPKDNITVLPFDNQIKKTTKSGEIDTISNNFKKTFDDYIDNFVPDINRDREESIEEDLKQGKEINVVAKKWGKSVGYVRNIHQKLGLPDRRKTPWKAISYIEYEPV